MKFQLRRNALLERMTTVPVQNGGCAWCGGTLIFNGRLRSSTCDKCGHVFCRVCGLAASYGTPYAPFGAVEGCPFCLVEQVSARSLLWRRISAPFMSFLRMVDMSIVMMLVVFVGLVALMGWMAYDTLNVPDTTPLLRSAYPAAQIINHQSQTTDCVEHG